MTKEEDTPNQQEIESGNEEEEPKASPKIAETSAIVEVTTLPLVRHVNASQVAEEPPLLESLDVFTTPAIIEP